MIRVTTWFVAMLIFSIRLSAQDAEQPPAQTIPNFTFFRFDGVPFTNKDLPQQKMLLFLFIDPDCDHCQDAIKKIGTRYEEFKGAAIYLISVADQNKLNHFMNSFGKGLKGRKNMTLLQDKLQQFIVRFNPRKYPSMLLYSRDKKLLDYEDNPETVFRLANTLKKNGP